MRRVSERGLWGWCYRYRSLVQVQHASLFTCGFSIARYCLVRLPGFSLDSRQISLQDSSRLESGESWLRLI